MPKIFMAQSFLFRLWITIHFLKGLCMNSMIKLVKHKWRSLQTKTLLGHMILEIVGFAHLGKVYFNILFVLRNNEYSHGHVKPEFITVNISRFTALIIHQIS